MVECKKCGKVFLNKILKADHICDKIEPGKATVKKSELKEETKKEVKASEKKTKKEVKDATESN